MDRTKKLLRSVTASALLAGSNPNTLDARAMRRIENVRHRLDGSYSPQTPDQVAQASQIISNLLSSVQEENAMSLNELLERRPDLERGAAEKAIRGLLKQGKIRKTGEGTKNKPFRYYDRSRGGHGG